MKEATRDLYNWYACYEKHT